MFDMTDDHFAIYSVALSHQQNLCSDELQAVECIQRRLEHCPTRGRFTTYRERLILERIARKLSRQVDAYKSKNRVDPAITSAGLSQARQILAQ
jgi:hypothetical protein